VVTDGRRPPGWLRAAGLLAAKDLKLEWRTKETATSTLVFSLVVVVTFAFAFGVDAARERGGTRVLAGLVWTVLFFATVVAMHRGARTEERHGVQRALLAAPVDRSAIYLGKAAANLVKLALLATLLVPAIGLLLSVDLGRLAGPLATVIALHAVGLVLLGTLFGAMAVRLGRGEALVVTLLFPAATPLMLSAVTCTAAVLDGRPLAAAGRWLAMAAGFDALFLFVALLTFEWVLEE
jgi:heme exporter protein B